MQDDQNPRKADAQKTKRSRELPSSTLWLRDDADTPAAREPNEPANEKGDPSISQNDPVSAQDKTVSVAASEVGEAVSPPSAPLVEESGVTSPYDAPAHGALVKHETPHSFAPDLQDAVNNEDERARDGSSADGEGARESAAAVARADSGFDAWPSTASETPVIQRPYFSAERPLLTPALGVTALAGLLLAAWSYSALEEARAQLTSVTQAKAAVDRSLADAQGRLAAVDKAFADVKSALGAPANATAGKAAEPKP